MNTLTHWFIREIRINMPGSYGNCFNHCCPVLFTCLYKQLQKLPSILLRICFVLLLYAGGAHSVQAEGVGIAPNISAPGQSIAMSDLTTSFDSTVFIWGGGSYDFSYLSLDSNEDIVSNETFLFVLDQQQGLLVYDLLTNSQLRLVGSLPLPSSNTDLALNNNFIYVPDQLLGLQIIDVSNPQKPILANRVALPEGNHYIGIEGHYAYLTDDVHGLIIIDITNPYEAFVVAFGKETNTFLSTFKDIKVEQNYAYLIDAENLYIVNISNAARPELIAELPMQGSLSKIAVHKQSVYITGDIELQVVDISNPPSPQLLEAHQILNGRGSKASFTTVKPRATEEIIIHQNRIYATHSLGGIEVFDIKESGKVEFLTLLHSIGVPNFIALNTHALFISTTRGLHYINLNSVSAPSVNRRIQVPEKFGTIDIGKNHAFVSAGGLLSIYNINNLQNTDLTAQLNLTSNPTELQFNNDYVYLTGDEKTLQIVDVSSTSSPKLIAEIDKSGTGISLDIQENLLAVIDEKLGLLLFNIAEPNSPELLSMTAIDKRLNDIKIFGHYIFISTYEELVIYDIIDPKNPKVPEETIDFYIENLTPFRPTLLEIWNNHLYVVNNAGVNVYEISNPLNPISLTSSTSNLDATDIEISDDILYISKETGGLMAFQLSTIKLPFLISETMTASHSFDLAMLGDHVFATDDMEGIVVLPKAKPSEWNVSSSGILNVDIPGHLPDGIYDIHITVINGSRFLPNSLRISTVPIFDLKQNHLFIPQIDIGSDVSYQAHLSSIVDENANLTFRLQSASAINSEYELYSNFSAEQGLLNLPLVKVVDEQMKIRQYAADLGLIMNSNPLEFYIKNVE